MKLLPSNSVVSRKEENPIKMLTLTSSIYFVQNNKLLYKQNKFLTVIKKSMLFTLLCVQVLRDNEKLFRIATPPEEKEAPC